MLQATRSAAGGGYRKKKNTHSYESNPRKSVRFGHNAKGAYQRPTRNLLHKGQTSPYGSKFNRRKRKSTVFKPTHPGQSAASMVQQSVFAQMDNPTSANQAKYEQYKSMQRRASIAARKKKEQDIVRKTVMMNAQQQQQLLRMVKGQASASDANTAKSKPVTPAIASAVASAAVSAAASPDIHGLHPSNDTWISRAKSHRNKGPMNPLDINASAALMESKSRQHSAVTTPIGKHDKPSSIGDALGLSQNEMDEYKTHIQSNHITYANTPDIRPVAAQYDHLPYKGRKRNSFSTTSDAFLTQQNTLRSNNAATTAPPPAYSKLRALKIQPHQVFTTPHSRRASIVRGAAQMTPHAHLTQIPNTSAAPIASMMMMIFSALPPQQKNEIMQLMTLSLRQQTSLNPALNNVNISSLLQQQSQGTPRLNPAVAAAVDMARKTQNATVDTGKTVIPHPLSTSKSMPAVIEDRGAFTPRTNIQRNTSHNAVSLMKDRVHLDITPQSTDQQHNEFGLFEIREVSEQSKATPLERISGSTSPRRPENERLPSNEPLIGGVLGTIQSQYDTDAINVAKETQDREEAEAAPQTENEEQEVTLFDERDMDSDYDGSAESHNYLQQIDPHLLDMTQEVYDIEPQKSNDKKVRFKDPTPEPPDPQEPLFKPTQHPTNDRSAGSLSLRIDAEEEEEDEDEKNETAGDMETADASQEIQMTPLLEEVERLLESGHNDGMALKKTPEIAVPSTSDLNVSPKKMLLTGEYISNKAAREDSEDKDAIDDDIDTRSRMSSKDLFLQDVMCALFPDDDQEDNQDTLRSGSSAHSMQSSSASDEVSQASSKTDSEEPDKYIVRLHPSRYQINKLGSDRMDGGSTESAETLTTHTTNTDRSKTVEDVNTQRIGITPLQSHAIAAASMMDIGIDPHTDDGESDEEEHNYFGQGTPTAVREGTETIQKTLRAVWVRGHTRIGTFIHFVLIVVNLVAAVMFVAAIEGYENEGLEYFFTSAFLVDFCVRLYAAKSAWSYLRSTKGIADFISVMPGIILAITDFNSDIPLWTFSFVRAMRVLRVLRLLAHMVNYEDYQEEERQDPIDVDAFEFGNELNERESEEQKKKGCCTKKFWVMSKVTYFKLTLVSYLVMVVFVAAGLFACVEGPQSSLAEPTVGNFFESFYFIVVTVTTVGYGDYSPVTIEGQICVILVIAIAFIVVPHRAAVLARLEFEYADQESEPSVMDFNMAALNDDMEEEMSEEGPRSFLGYCANCQGPRWTHGTAELPISCMHCFHPVLTPEQVDAWFPDIAEALNEFVTAEQNELLSLMLDAKEGADNGLLAVFQEMVRCNVDPTMIANATVNAAMLQQQQQIHPAAMMTKTPSMNTGAYTSMLTTPVGGHYDIDPQLLYASTFAGGGNGAGMHSNVYTDLYNGHRAENEIDPNQPQPQPTQLDQHQSHSAISALPATTALQVKHMQSHSDMVAIEEETSEIIMESPQEAKNKEIKNHKQAQQLVLNENKGTKKFRVSVTPVPIQEDHVPHMPPSDDDEEEEEHGDPVHIEYIEYARTPSMEESETLGGFNSFNPTPATPDDEEDEAIEPKKKQTPVPTPISTTSNYSNRSGHMRKATPAEMPSVKAIKKFSINLNETPLCEEMEEFTPRADEDIPLTAASSNQNSYDYGDMRRVTNSMITPEPGVGSDSIDDSYNDALDEEEDLNGFNNDEYDEEKSSKPLRPKSTGDILKKHILAAMHPNGSKHKHKGDKIKGGSYKKKYEPYRGASSSNSNEVSSDDRSDFDTSYEDDEDENDEDIPQAKTSHPKHQLSIIIDGAPKTRERAHTTKVTTSPNIGAFGVVSRHSKYNSMTGLNSMKKSKKNDKARFGDDLANSMHDDDITPQEYEQMMRFYHKLDKASTTNSPKLRRSTKDKKDKPLTPLQRFSQQRASKLKMEMLTKQILASKLANEAANSVNDGYTKQRSNTTRHRGGSHQQIQHRAYKSGGHHLNYNSDYNSDDPPGPPPNLYAHNSQPRSLGKLGAFTKHAKMAKSVTDLFVMDTINKHSNSAKKGKKGKKGSKGSPALNSYNPKEHIASKLVQNIEDQFGADSVPALTTELIQVPKVNTPILQSPSLASYSSNRKKTSKGKGKKKKKMQKR